MYSYYKKYKRLPVYDDTIKVYSLENTQKGFKAIFENFDITDWELGAETGLSRYHIKNFRDASTGPRAGVWEVYIASKIIDNPKYKSIMPKLKKIELVNPRHIKRLCKEVGADVNTIYDFTHKMYSKHRIISSLKAKEKTGLKMDMAIAITAMYKYYLAKQDVKKDRLDKIMNPNTRKRMMYNDRVERYRSGYLPPVQQKTRKSS